MSPSYGFETHHERIPMKCPSLIAHVFHMILHDVELKSCVIGDCTSSTDKDIL